MGTPFLQEFLGIQFFGEFLIDRWIINREQLLQALDYQTERNARFGEIAVRKSLLDDHQVQTINERQRNTDMSFGKLAISLGALTEQEASEIFNYQCDNNLHLGEILLRLGFIDEPTLRNELESFHQLQKRWVPDKVIVPDGLGDGEVVRACVDITRKMFQRVVGFSLKVGRGVFLQPGDELLGVGYHVTITVPLQGNTQLQYLLSVTRPVALAITASMLRQNRQDFSRELIVDAVKELTNFVCGNSVAQLASRNTPLEIGPPQHLEQMPSPPPEYHTVAFPIRLVEGGVDVRFFVPKA